MNGCKITVRMESHQIDLKPSKTLTIIKLFSIYQLCEKQKIDLSFRPFDKQLVDGLLCGGNWDPIRLDPHSGATELFCYRFNCVSCIALTRCHLSKVNFIIVLE